MRARPSRGLTLIEVLIAAVLLMVMLAVALTIGRRDYMRPCQNNLKALGIALCLYLDGQGRRTQYPDADGSDFLIRLYTTGIAADPGQFLCPATSDDNARGRTLRPGGGRAPVNATSYAGRRNAVNGQNTWPGLYTARGCGVSHSVAADDDEGPGWRFNHGRNRINILFEDAHVEVLLADDPRRGAHGAAKPRFDDWRHDQGLDPLAN